MKLTNYFLNFDFNGRARRSHYWANLGCWLLVVVGLFLIMAASGGAMSGPGDAAKVAGGTLGVVGGLVWLLAIPLSIIDNMAMVFRRAHDTGKSGWIWLLLLIPIINLLPFYWLMIQDSDQGANKYGPPVKQFYVPPVAA